MPIKNIMITSLGLEYTNEYIANTFWQNRIAKIRYITLFPYLNTQFQIRNIAYLTVDHWCETEAAFNFLQRLKQGEARIVHRDDEWFAVQVNPHSYPNVYGVRVFTTEFDDAYYNKTAPCSDDEDEEEDDDILNKVCELHKDLDYVESEAQRRRLQFKLEQLEVEAGIC